MAITRLRQQGGAVILTIPSDVIAKMGWAVGTEVNVAIEKEGISVIPTKRIPRGRKSVSQLLAEIDAVELEQLNRSVDDMNNLPAVGKEVY
ncbi:Growth regulator [Leminorella richardii]|uniref:Growth regulator n=1 Tax=Leminorella richardii TaxID=158841 RepID=A0A2X4UW63_9GAMM|nr:AbrB/MazE/SpoVT family DNA-binding domain-containing protein [Leminorella richardii]SQI44096.1 Growth regulator [Leminorella richardii]